MPLWNSSAAAAAAPCAAHSHHRLSESTIKSCTGEPANDFESLCRRISACTSVNRDKGSGTQVPCLLAQVVEDDDAAGRVCKREQLGREGLGCMRQAPRRVAARCRA